MSMEAIRHASEVRRRLMNPPNGKKEWVETPYQRALQDLSELRWRITEVTTERDRARKELEAVRSDLAAAHRVISGRVDGEQPSSVFNRFKRIVAVTCEHYGIRASDFYSHRRPAQFIKARHVAWFVATKMTTMSLAEIGRRANRDHTTVMHGVDALQVRLDVGADDALAQDVAIIITKVHTGEKTDADSRATGHVDSDPADTVEQTGTGNTSVTAGGEPVA